MSSLESSFLQSSSCGDLAKVQNFIEKSGVNVDVQGEMNRSALHLASLFGKIEVVMYLVEKGAKINTQAISGETPLHLAVLNGHTNVAEFLLSEKADWNITNKTGKKPQDYARKKPMKKLFEDAEKGIFNAEEENGEKLLGLIRKKGLPINEKIIEELMAAGYPRGDILDSVMSLQERGENINSIANVMKELEKKKRENLEKPKLEEKEEEKLCKICFEEEIDTVITPCGHVAICLGCSKGLVLCPMCRNKINQVIKMFKS